MATTYHDNVGTPVQPVESVIEIRSIGMSDLHRALKLGWGPLGQDLDRPRMLEPFGELFDSNRNFLCPDNVSNLGKGWPRKSHGSAEEQDKTEWRDRIHHIPRRHFEGKLARGMGRFNRNRRS